MTPITASLGSLVCTELYARSGFKSNHFQLIVATGWLQHVHALVDCPCADTGACIDGEQAAFACHNNIERNIRTRCWHLTGDQLGKQLADQVEVSRLPWTQAQIPFGKCRRDATEEKLGRFGQLASQIWRYIQDISRAPANCCSFRSAGTMCLL